ncbi:hypothetical protein B0A49_00121 [Cryomyces minteri]|uniref:Uncharacterized protein n=1 Tax=Cryomyces minteri TaxID=331657 RepID=A0A4U0XWG2_9PEZI|nr:hypothetical protein B0A49_00121 [Cryomyces minteri]
MSSQTDSQSTRPYTYQRASTMSTRAILDGTDSPLTPGTRSEAEAALSANIDYQTSSAAPITSQHTFPSSGNNDGLDEVDGDVHGSVFRPGMPRRTTTHYEEAAAAAARATATHHETPPSTAPEQHDTTGYSYSSASPSSSAYSAAAAAARHDRPEMLGRQQSWSAQDLKRMMSERLMAGGSEGAGFSENRGLGVKEWMDVMEEGVMDDQTAVAGPADRTKGRLTTAFFPTFLTSAIHGANERRGRHHNSIARVAATPLIDNTFLHEHLADPSRSTTSTTAANCAPRASPIPILATLSRQRAALNEVAVYPSSELLTPTATPQPAEDGICVGDFSPPPPPQQREHGTKNEGGEGVGNLAISTSATLNYPSSLPPRAPFRPPPLAPVQTGLVTQHWGLRPTTPSRRLRWVAALRLDSAPLHSTNARSSLWPTVFSSTGAVASSPLRTQPAAFGSVT